jgi:hypothetical protein
VRLVMAVMRTWKKRKGEEWKKMSLADLSEQRGLSWGCRE